MTKLNFSLPEQDQLHLMNISKGYGRNFQAQYRCDPAGDQCPDNQVNCFNYYGFCGTGPAYCSYVPERFERDCGCQMGPCQPIC